MASHPTPQHEVRNPALRSALIALASESIVFLRPPLTQLADERLRLGIWIRQRENELRELDVWKKAETLILADAELSRHFGTLVGASIVGRHRLEIHDFFCRLILETLDENRHFDPHRFDAIYLHLESFLYDPTMLMVTTAPLQGVGLDCDQIEIGKATIRATDWQHPALDAMNDEFTNLTLHMRMSVAVKVEYVYRARKLFGDEPEESSDRLELERDLDCLVQAMRVLKPGRFAALWIGWKADTWGPMLAHAFRHISPLDNSIWPNNYTLGVDDRDDLARLKDAIEACHRQPASALAVSLHWFSKALEEREVGDRLISLAIAAEAFYLKDGREGELRYRFAQRLAVYLEETPDARLATNKFAKRIYDLRSDLVHGNTTPNRLKLPKVTHTGEAIHSLEYCLKAFESLMRSSLNKALSTPAAQRPCDHPEMWDDLLFRA